VTVEEGVAIGGFGSAITDLLVEEMGGSLPRIVRLALPDSFPHKYGGQNDLLELYGLMPHQIAATVAKSVNKKEKVA
jgi:transketolase